MSVRRRRVLLVLAGIAVLAVSCSPQTRHDLLSFFFDGVPPLESEEESSPSAEPAAPGGEAAPGAGAERAAELTGSRHPPFAERNCSDCHEGNRLVLQGSELCFTCHDASTMEGPAVHTAVAIGECTTCHNPHQSRLPRLLRSEGAALCAPCHGTDRSTGTGVHQPVAEGQCLTCHAPHVGENPGLLSAPLPEFCFTCHEGTWREAEVPHMPVADGECMICHDPHKAAAPEGKLLVASPTELCFICHDGSWLELPVLHAPAAMGECASCHTVHGGAREHLLAGPVVEVCSSCHAEDPEVKPHIEDVKAAEMICTECHEPHASKLPKLIK